VNRLVALIAIGLVAVTAATLVGVPDSQAVPLQPVARSVGLSTYSSVPACAISELHVTYYGVSAATGTGITDFEVSDISRHACVLLGTPTVSFFTGSLHAPRVLPVVVTNTGPGVAFALPPREVLLEPKPHERSAGWLFTSADVGLYGSDNCPQITEIGITVSGSTAQVRVPLWYPAGACSSAGDVRDVNVSDFFPASDLDPYALPTLSPLCTASDVAVTTTRVGVAMGHVGATIEFQNIGLIPCRIRGYPGVIGVETNGLKVKAKGTPYGYLGGLASGTTTPPLVNLAPRQRASASIEGDDMPQGATQSCHQYSYVLVSLPYETQRVRLPLKMRSCSGLQVHPVVPGVTGH
jgi:hypothetical protein